MKKDKKDRNRPDSIEEEMTDTAAGKQDSSETAEAGSPLSDEAPDQAGTNTADETAKELAEMKDRYLRLLAEYDNYRKRTAKEKESFYSMAKADTVERFLPVYDNIERAVNVPTQDEAYKKGVEMILQQLKDAFKLLGVNEIECGGEKFDPDKHNAVLHVDDDNLDENVVAEVFQRGFEIDGKVIRHAVVKVAN